ncbi:MAG: hypothetical protein JOY58_08810 [Solirubrobacterales bacterium]|nr:hypothetical protein [Solirubrobacterales bacterium]
MRDRTSAKLLAEQVGIAVLASSRDSVDVLDALGDGVRHVEVGVIADEHGSVWAAGVRDCSLQLRGQKLVEESRSPALASEQEEELVAAALALIRAAGYRNAGTVEFLYDPTRRSFALSEIHASLQVAHPVTEVTTGLDLVKLQLEVAAGGRLPHERPTTLGHAIGARLLAHDPERGLEPAPGTIELFQLPTGAGVRVDSGVAEGEVITPAYDSVLAEVVAWGRDRSEARARLRCALADATVVIRGGITNKTFLLHLLDHPDVSAGHADAGWLDRLVEAGAHVPREHADVALLAAAVDSYDAEEDDERERFYASAARGRPRATQEIDRTLELVHRGQAYRVQVGEVGPARYRVTVDGVTVYLDAERLGRFQSRLRIGARTFRVVSLLDGADHVVEVEGVGHRVSVNEGVLVRASGPGVVAAVTVAPGDEVAAGVPIAVLEAMKLETPVDAPVTGRVREVLAGVNVQVDAGAPLVRLEPTDGSGPSRAGADRIRLAPPARDGEHDPGTASGELLESIRSLIMGFDISAGTARQLAADFERIRAALPPDDCELLRGELELLTVFADIAELSRAQLPTDEEEEDADVAVHSPRELFRSFLRSLDPEREGLPDAFRKRLERAVIHYGVEGLARTDSLERAIYRIFLAHQRAQAHVAVIVSLLDRRLRHAQALPQRLQGELRETLDRLLRATQARFPVIGDLARSVRFRCFDQPLIDAARDTVYAAVRQQLAYLAAHPDAPDYAERIESVVASPQPLIPLLAERLAEGLGAHEPMLEVLTRRYYKIRPLESVQSFTRGGFQFVAAEYELRGQRMRLVSTVAQASKLEGAIGSVAALVADVRTRGAAVADLYVAWDETPRERGAMSAQLRRVLDGFPATALRVTFAVGSGAGADVDHFTFRPVDGGFAEDPVMAGLHPMIAQRLQLWRLENFDLTRLPSPQDVYLFLCTGRENPGDQRFVALAEVRDPTPVRDAAGTVTALPELEHVLAASLESIRRVQSERPPNRRLHSNHVLLYLWPPLEVSLDEALAVAGALAPLTAGLGLAEVTMHARIMEEPGAELREVALHFAYHPTAGTTLEVTEPASEPLAPLGEYEQKVMQARRRGAVYPYELIPSLARPGGTFTEYDLDELGELVPVERGFGSNNAGVVVGVVRTPTARYPEGMTRVALFGDPTKALGSIAEPECRRVVAALDLAERMRAPVEWLTLSAGAKIAMDSGTENMDWVSRVLRRLITFTQAGGEVNVIVAGINVGAQPYWNSEATMLMHTHGILVMTPDSAMVLTGKQSLDYSGGVSAEDNFGIGGYDRIMGPNGQAQYWAPDLASACTILHSHYDHNYIAPGERFPRRAETDDDLERDVRAFPHALPESEFTTVADIFSDERNPARKKPFDIRTVMRAVADQDHPPLERWAGMADAGSVVVWAAHLGGFPVAVLGIESRSLPRHGSVPADGPDRWSGGTLFPMSSLKAARAINAASGKLPLVVLANLSGFDGSPESLRNRQLEYGAEIGRAIVNFQGPIIFCGVSRYHGGAFVVFSGTLNDNMEVVALEGSRASVLGGAPAAAVVFTRDVTQRTEADPRVRELEQRVDQADDDERARLRSALADLKAAVRSEKLGEVAAEFDRIHSVERAREMGSVHAIIPPGRLRPYLIEAVERGMRRTLQPEGAPPVVSSERS